VVDRDAVCFADSSHPVRHRSYPFEIWQKAAFRQRPSVHRTSGSIAATRAAKSYLRAWVPRVRIDPLIDGASVGNLLF
jgi:hypothetical protein